MSATARRPCSATTARPRRAVSTRSTSGSTPSWPCRPRPSCNLAGGNEMAALQATNALFSPPRWAWPSSTAAGRPASGHPRPPRGGRAGDLVPPLDPPGGLHLGLRPDGGGPPAREAHARPPWSPPWGRRRSAARPPALLACFSRSGPRPAGGEQRWPRPEFLPLSSPRGLRPRTTFGVPNPLASGPAADLDTSPRPHRELLPRPQPRDVGLRAGDLAPRVGAGGRALRAPKPARRGWSGSLLGMILLVETTQNWNAGTVGMIRYAVGSSPFSPGWPWTTAPAGGPSPGPCPRPVLQARTVGCATAWKTISTATAWHASPAPRAPRLYNPEFEIFAERQLHREAETWKALLPIGFATPEGVITSCWSPGGRGAAAPAPLRRRGGTARARAGGATPTGLRYIHPPPAPCASSSRWAGGSGLCKTESACGWPAHRKC